jgi:hypothetical protein
MDRIIIIMIMIHLLGQPPRGWLAAADLSPEGEIGHGAQLQPVTPP